MWEKLNTRQCYLIDVLLLKDAKTYPNGASVTYTYDANYNLISETSAGGGVTYYEYDKIGRNTAIVDALGNRTAFFYNANRSLKA